jgi:hypothetical protein
MHQVSHQQHHSCILWLDTGSDMHAVRAPVVSISHSCSGSSSFCLPFLAFFSLHSSQQCRQTPPRHAEWKMESAIKYSYHLHSCASAESTSIARQNATCSSIHTLCSNRTTSEVVFLAHGDPCGLGVGGCKGSVAEFREERGGLLLLLG